MSDMHRTNLAFLYRKRPRHTHKSRGCSRRTPHLMGHGPGRPVKTRRWPYGRGGRRRSSSSRTPHLLCSGRGRPVKTRRPPHGQGGAAYIEPTSHGPGPSISRGWAAARPGPSECQRMGRDPTQPIKFSIFPARPGPAQTNGP